MEKDLVDKLLKSTSDLRDKALGVVSALGHRLHRPDQSQGHVHLRQVRAGGDWVLGEAKKKTKWDAVNGILDALEKPVKEFVDNPGGSRRRTGSTPRSCGSSSSRART